MNRLKQCQQDDCPLAVYGAEQEPVAALVRHGDLWKPSQRPAGKLDPRWAATELVFQPIADVFIGIQRSSKRRVQVADQLSNPAPAGRGERVTSEDLDHDRRREGS